MIVGGAGVGDAVGASVELGDEVGSAVTEGSDVVGAGSPSRSSAQPARARVSTAAEAASASRDVEALMVVTLSERNPEKCASSQRMRRHAALFASSVVEELVFFRFRVARIGVTESESRDRQREGENAERVAEGQRHLC